jgi:hypothetical protein
MNNGQSVADVEYIERNMTGNEPYNPTAHILWSKP